MSEWTGTLWRALLDASLRMLVVASGVALIIFIFRVRSNALRHVMWSMAVSGMLLMPVLPRFVPPLTFPVSTPVMKVPVDLPVQQPVFQATPEQVVPTFSPIVVPDNTVPGSLYTFLPTMVAGLYVAGVLYLFLRLFIGWRAMRRLLRTGRRIQITGVDPVYESAYVVSPVTVGVFAPAVILPSSWRSWNEQELRAILAHESAHIRRHDGFFSFLSQLNCALFWFHPLAWWMKSKVAMAAECACDDAAVEAVGTRTAYAEILLNVAETVHRHRCRFSWQAIGVHGNGFLEKRIDRILQNKAADHISKTRRRLISTVCAVFIFLVVACRDQSAPLFSVTEIKDIKTEENLAAMRRAAEGARMKEQQLKWIEEQRSLDAIRKMTPAQVAELESHVRQDPGSLETREKLIYFYGALVEKSPQQDPTTIAAYRDHILWTIQHHPDHEVLGASVSRISPRDPEGYAKARDLWLVQANRSDAAASVLSNAAYFFEVSDKPLTEKLLVRGQTMQPDSEWKIRLARLYAFALLGVTEAYNFGIPGDRPERGTLIRSVSDAEARSPYTDAVREKLAASKDPQLLNNVARYLMLHRQRGPSLAKTYFERALQLDPQILEAHQALARIRSQAQSEQVRALLMTFPKEGRYEVIASLPVRDRFLVSEEMARYAYGEGNSLEVLDRDGAKAARERARKYAEDLLKLAPQFTKDPDYSGAVFTGNVIAGMIAARNGDSATGVKYLRDAFTVPPSEEMAYQPPLVPYEQLCRILAGSGYRDDVIAFLEHFAQINMSQRDYLLGLVVDLRK